MSINVVLALIYYIITPFIYTLLDIIFPTRCAKCGTGKTYCCSDCLNTLTPANTMDLPPDHIAIWDYKQPAVKKLIHLLKYRGARSVAKVFAQAIYDKLIDELAEAESFDPSSDKWLLVPIPLSIKRRKKRGFNQSEEIAKYLLRSNSRNFEAGFEILIKPVDTQSQALTKNREARLRNMRGAFAAAKPEEIAGRNIILLDDVITTGATVGEARRALCGAGARRVLVCAVAHGQ